METTSNTQSQRQEAGHNSMHQFSMVHQIVLVFEINTAQIALDRPTLGPGRLRMLSQKVSTKRSQCCIIQNPLMH